MIYYASSQPSQSTPHFFFPSLSPYFHLDVPSLTLRLFTSLPIILFTPNRFRSYYSSPLFLTYFLLFYCQGCPSKSVLPFSFPANLFLFLICRLSASLIHSFLTSYRCLFFHLSLPFLFYSFSNSSFPSSHLISFFSLTYFFFTFLIHSVLPPLPSLSIFSHFLVLTLHSLSLASHFPFLVYFLFFLSQLLSPFSFNTFL